MSKPILTINQLGDKYWTVDNIFHREEIDPITGLSLPALEVNNGAKYWYRKGRYHREDGPAIEWQEQTYYYINGNYIPQLDNKRIYGKDKLAKYLVLL